jgi:hypothetical protein
MTTGNGTHSPFQKNIEKAVKAIQAKDYVTAQDCIKSTMLENDHAPEIHNLLGALAELTGDLGLAGKHYRAAFALEPTYKPAIRNLDRITAFNFRVGDTNPDFGNVPEIEEIIPYDSGIIGHLIKKD